jgi:hypothetical protein
MKLEIEDTDDGRFWVTKNYGQDGTEKVGLVGAFATRELAQLYIDQHGTVVEGRWGERHGCR